MAKSDYEMLQTIDKEKFTSQVVRQQYEILRELASAFLLSKGFKTSGEGAHKEIIQWLSREKIISEK